MFELSREILSVPVEKEVRTDISQQEHFYLCLLVVGFVVNCLFWQRLVLIAADHDASEAGEEEDKENKAEASEVRWVLFFLQNFY